MPCLNNLSQCYANKLNTVWTEGDCEVLNWQESDSEQAIKEKVMYQIKLCVPMICIFHTILCIMHYGTCTALGFLSHDNLVMTWSQFKVVLTTILCLRHFHKKMLRISWGIQLNVDGSLITDIQILRSKNPEKGTSHGTFLPCVFSLHCIFNQAYQES